MQREPHAPRYVKGECYAEPRAADIEQLHAVPPMQPRGFDACVGGEMQSYLKKKDNSLKSGVSWRRSQRVPFPIKIILICTCLHVSARSSGSCGAALPGIHSDAQYPQPVKLSGVCRITALGRACDRKYPQCHGSCNTTVIRELVVNGFCKIGIFPGCITQAVL